MIAKALKILFPDIKLPAECLVISDQNGERIVTWKRPEPQPTPAQLQAAFDAPQRPVVPEFVRTAQLIQWLIDRDLLAAVEAKLNDPSSWPDEKTRLKAKARYEREANTVRADPLVIALGRDLGMDDAQLDAAFIEISQIP